MHKAVRISLYYGMNLADDGYNHLEGYDPGENHHYEVGDAISPTICNTDPEHPFSTGEND